eukprot:4208557-Amphidinium_carterae.1
MSLMKFGPIGCANSSWTWCCARVLIYIEGPASNHLNNGDWFSLHVTVPAVNEFTLERLLASLCHANH